MAITTQSANLARSGVKTYAHVIDGRIAEIATCAASEPKPLGLSRAGISAVLIPQSSTF